jgi:hypothetical protein
MDQASGARQTAYRFELSQRRCCLSFWRLCGLKPQSSRTILRVLRRLQLSFGKRFSMHNNRRQLSSSETARASSESAVAFAALRVTDAASSRVRTREAPLVPKRQDRCDLPCITPPQDGPAQTFGRVSIKASKMTVAAEAIEGPVSTDA